jgi:hypothetical protein
VGIAPTIQAWANTPTVVPSDSGLVLIRNVRLSAMDKKNLYYLKFTGYSNRWYIIYAESNDTQYLHRDGNLYDLVSAGGEFPLTQKPINAETYPGYWESAEDAENFFRQKMKGKTLIKI